MYSTNRTASTVITNLTLSPMASIALVHICGGTETRNFWPVAYAGEMSHQVQSVHYEGGDSNLGHFWVLMWFSADYQTQFFTAPMEYGSANEQLAKISSSELRKGPAAIRTVSNCFRSEDLTKAERRLKKIAERSSNGLSSVIPGEGSKYTTLFSRFDLGEGDEALNGGVVELAYTEEGHVHLRCRSGSIRLPVISRPVS